MKLNNKNYNTWATLMKSYLQDYNLWEIICGNNVKPPTEDTTLKMWNIKVGKVMLALKSTIKEKMS